MGSCSLALVDVNTCTALTTWPMLLNAIANADFISIDLELSGLGGRVSTRTMEDHYQGLCAVVSSRAILSLGVACFKWSGIGLSGSKPVPLKVQVFNVWLLTQQPFTTDPSSAQFLVEHGFNFNKQYSQGLPYTPPSKRTEVPTFPQLKRKSEATPPPTYSLDLIFASVLDHGVPLVLHNGWLDLLFLYYSCYGPLPTSSMAFMADLIEMFPAGIYDTKAIAQFKVHENATYLEYVFRICQRRNSVSCSEKRRHLVLEIPLEADTLGDFVETVEIGFPPSLTPQQLFLIHICQNFKDYGFCHTPNCSESHDTILAIEKAEQETVDKSYQKRKRRTKAKARLKTKRLKLEDKEDNQLHKGLTAFQSCDSHVTPEPSGDLTSLFQHELTTARAKLTSTKSSWQGTEQNSREETPSYGHRAGFDAFMTGFAFACYALQSADSADLSGGYLGGLERMKNCLPSRPGNWRVPLYILKSHFVKTSSTHSIARERMKEVIAQKGK